MPAPSLRRETAGLVRLAGNDLDALWRLVTGGASAEVALNDLLPAIIISYGEAGAAMAADWYDEARDVADVAGRFSAIPVPAGDRGARSLIGWALGSATDDLSLRTLIAGGVQRRIANNVRDTIATSSVADPRARGWSRVGAGRCEFCAMLIGRGAVYTEATADFAAHDHCGCMAVPEFG